MTNLTQDERTSTARTGWPARIGTVLAAALGAVLVPVVAGGNPRVDQNGTVDAVGPAAVLVASVLSGLAGWALLAILERTTARPGTIWAVVASLLAVLSLVGPLQAGVDGPSIGTLVAMHLVVAAILVPAYALVARPRRKR